MTAQERYINQVRAMAELARAWRKANPKKVAKVQFNFPRKHMVFGTISDAIERHFVVANQAGLELIKAMGEWGGAGEPTVFMVKVVLENPNL